MEVLLSDLLKNIEAEKSLIAAMMMGAAKEVIRKARLEDFYSDRHKAIYQAANELVIEGIEVDLSTLATKTNGTVKASYLSEILDYPASMSIDWTVERLREAFYRRQALMDSQTMREAALNAQDFEEVRKITRQAAQKMDEPIGGMSWNSFEEVAYIAPDEWEKLSSIGGISTGFPSIDKPLGWMQPGDLIVLGARPSMGKTAFATNIAENVARAGRSVGFFSLEMTTLQLYGRVTARNARVDATKFRTGQFEPHEWKKIMAVQENLQKLKFHVDENPALHYQEIARRARNLHDKSGLDFVVIDYLQLARSDSYQGRRDLEVGAISSAMKALAKEIDIPVLLLSQLNRKVEERPDKRPMLADLRDSGNIEQDADIVLFLYRDEKYNPNTESKGIVEVGIGKSRFSNTEVVKLRFIGWRQCFEELG